MTLLGTSYRLSNPFLEIVKGLRVFYTFPFSDGRKLIAKFSTSLSVTRSEAGLTSLREAIGGGRELLALRIVVALHHRTLGWVCSPPFPKALLGNTHRPTHHT